MIRRYVSRPVLLLFFLDQVVLLGSLLAALWIKREWILIDPNLPSRMHLGLFLRLWPFLALAVVLAGAYDLQVAVGRMWPLLRRTLVASGAVALVWVLGAFFLRVDDLLNYSRAAFLLFLALSTVGLIGARLGVAQLVGAWRERMGRHRRVLVIGGELHGRELFENLQRQIFAPIRIVGVTGAGNFRNAPRLSEETALSRIRQGEVDHVIVDLPPTRIRLLLRVTRAAEIEGVPLQLTPAIFPGIHFRPSVELIGQVPTIALWSRDLPLSGQVAKRALDVVLSAIGVAVLSPLLVGIAVLIRLTSPGPVLYAQRRIGLDGRPFKMFKFRSMSVDAESETGPVWAVPNDARRTRLGTFLRRTNIDELPQLFNVLIGNMSLVGPRPERPEFVEQFKPTIERYSHKHWVKPGITGWAQVNGWRGSTDLKARIEHDVYYIERWSLWLDLKILLLTITRGYKNAH